MEHVTTRCADGVNIVVRVNDVAVMNVLLQHVLEYEDSFGLRGLHNVCGSTREVRDQPRHRVDSQRPTYLPSHAIVA